ncbi:MAG: glycosyltransferase [Bdellovibrionales bacterium RIFOXYC1_FULL_54_43]|nr:MAG: glycosyltransferase [Bdellovibrionales bacterium RIFOXYC1_FULL_54_43]OFZ80630.1 MAG: glycosyltransferase [Bdellovibrionales bacterium RIFOXYD1_FULL_55_31]
MKFAIFCESILSDWNHGNAHFLRGIVTELTARGHQVSVFEPVDSWSLGNLVADHGFEAVSEYTLRYPTIRATRYERGTLDLDTALDSADVVLVHEWNTPDLIKNIGKHRARTRRYQLLFHDSHHRMATDQAALSRYDLSNYDGVLAFGKVIADLYRTRGLAARAWTWHEAADTRVFRPMEPMAPLRSGHLVWIGNWGDDERTDELREFLLEPSRSLALKTEVYGVRYPDEARQKLKSAGIAYQGWIANYRVPEVFARFHATVHIPRRPYVENLPGIPTIRVFEALACGIPLISAPWSDAENLFTPGRDFLVARDGTEMREHLKTVMHDRDLRTALSHHGLQTILKRHTCSHRTDELLAICRELRREPECLRE